MTRMKPLGGALTILVAVLAGCGGGGGNEAEERISACTTEVSSSVLEGIGLSGEPNAKLLSAAEAYCRDAEAEGALEDEEIARERTGALISDHASRLFTPICDRLAGRVREAMPAEALRYLTDAGFQGYGKGVCAVAGD